MLRRTALTALVGSFAVVAGVISQASGNEGPAPKLSHWIEPPLSELDAPDMRLEAEPLSPELRQRGYHECYPHDPLGLGPYAPYRNLSMGRILIPERGGHTEDMGFDVLVHFHGHEPLRKTLVQVARGVVYVGIDRGLGSGPYADAFAAPGSFERLRASITRALQKHSGDPRAHIRHLALSAWSAGYGAVNQILKHGDEGIDAVVLLDALHAGYKPGAPHDQRVSSLSDAFIAPVLRFAEKAVRGEKIFIFTHSEVDPVKYPSTKATADLMLDRLGLSRTATSPERVSNGVAPNQRFAQTGFVDQGNFHLWSFAGGNERAHCSHIAYITSVVRDILEPSWKTPSMERESDSASLRQAQLSPGID